jgi:hypothetical protein
MIRYDLRGLDLEAGVAEDHVGRADYRSAALHFRIDLFRALVLHSQAVRSA